MSEFTNPSFGSEPMGEKDILESETSEEIQGRVRAAASGVADRMRGAGRYLRETDMRGMVTDMTDMIRRYPLQTLMVGIGLGFVVGRIRRH
jgi:hypothetical protein